MSDAVKNANRVVLNVTDEGSPSRLEMLTHQAGTRLLKTASQKPEWETAYLAAVLAVGTTARGCELRGLRWADVNLIDRAVTLASEDKWGIAPAARLDACRIKTSESYRVVSLTPETLDALLKLRKRAEMFGPVEHHTSCSRLSGRVPLQKPCGDAWWNGGRYAGWRYGEALLPHPA